LVRLKLPKPGDKSPIHEQPFVISYKLNEIISHQLIFYHKISQNYISSPFEDKNLSRLIDKISDHFGLRVTKFKSMYEIAKENSQRFVVEYQNVVDPDNPWIVKKSVIDKKK